MGWIKLVMGVLGLVVCCGLAGIRINLGDSMPKGLYYLTSDPPTLQQLASSCLDQSIADRGKTRGYLASGWCNTGIRPVMKHIYALPGDRIEHQDGYLVINGEVNRTIKLYTKDSAGNPLSFNYTTPYYVPEERYMLISTHVENSWDSRYFGAVEIERSMKPWWLF